MNKAELIQAIATSAKLNNATTEKALNGLIGAVTEALQKGDSVSWVGFGTFAVRERAEQPGRNPQTGEPITIQAAKVPAFSPGKGLKEAVNS